jgi:hypothetical protein
MLSNKEIIAILILRLALVSRNWVAGVLYQTLFSVMQVRG